MLDDILDVRIATIGNVDSGKSTIVGVLTSNKLDDGRGSVRQTVFNFKQEKETGRTSSIGTQIMGFNDENEQVLMEHQKANKNQNWSHVVSKSKKVVTFLFSISSY